MYGVESCLLENKEAASCEGIDSCIKHSRTTQPINKFVRLMGLCMKSDFGFEVLHGIHPSLPFPPLPHCPPPRPLFSSEVGNYCSKLLNGKGWIQPLMKEEVIVRIVFRSAQYAKIAHTLGIVSSWIGELELYNTMCCFQKCGYRKELGDTIKYWLEDCRHFMKDAQTVGLLLTKDIECAVLDLPSAFQVRSDTCAANFAKLVWRSDTLQILYDDLYAAEHLYHTFEDEHRLQWWEDRCRQTFMLVQSLDGKELGLYNYYEEYLKDEGPFKEV